MKYYDYYCVQYQQTALTSSNTSELVSTGDESESKVFDSPANPNKEILMDNFQFTKPKTFATYCVKRSTRNHLQNQMKTFNSQFQRHLQLTVYKDQRETICKIK